MVRCDRLSFCLPIPAQCSTRGGAYSFSRYPYVSLFLKLSPSSPSPEELCGRDIAGGRAGIEPAAAIFFIAGQRPSTMVPVMRAPARIVARVASLRCYGYAR